MRFWRSCRSSSAADARVRVMQSRIGFMLMVAGLAGLIAGRAIVSANPLVIACQAVAVFLMLWARVTFGRRSFHASATPTDGGLVTDWAVPVHPPPDLWECLSLCLGEQPGTSVRFFCSHGAASQFRRRDAHGSRGAPAPERYPEYANYAARTKRIVPFVF